MTVDLPAWLRGIQARHGLSTAELAAQAGMEADTLAAILRGEWSPPPATVAMLEQRLQPLARSGRTAGLRTPSVTVSPRASSAAAVAPAQAPPLRRRPVRRRSPAALLVVLAFAVAAALAAAVAAASLLSPAETLTLQAEAGADGVRLHWEPGADPARPLVLERRLAEGDAWAKVSDVKAGDPGLDDRLPPSNQPRVYSYRVRAGDGSAQSPPVAVTVPAWDPALVLPTPTPLPRATAAPRAATVTGTPAFRAEVEAAVRLLEQGYPAGFARYSQYARTVREEEAADAGDACAFTRTFAREIAVYRGCVEAEPPGPERTRRLAATLAQQATHLQVELAGANRMSAQVDLPALRTRVAELTQQRRQQERERALAQLDAERQAGYAECNLIIGEAEDNLLRLPGSTPSYAATVRATAVERAHGCRTDVDSRVGFSAGQRAEGAMVRLVGRDWVADYVAGLERREGVRLTPTERTTLVEAACWGQQERLTAYLALGGASAAELPTVLFLAQPECRPMLRSAE